MPYISTEALVGAALIVVLAFGYQYSTAGSDLSGSGAKKNNNKKKSRKRGSGKGAAGDVAVPAAAAAVSVDSDASAATGKKGKGKGKGKAKAAAKPAPATSSPALASVSASTSQTPSQSDSETPAPSFAAAASGSSAPQKPKLLAEKILPKPRKTRVDDMLAPEDRPPQIARVMKIIPEGGAPTPPPASAAERIPKFEDDYTESASDSVTDEPGPSEEEWNVVSTKKKPMSISIGGGGSSYSGSSSHNDAPTKLQRKNQKKTEAKKAQKAADEADRLRRLAMHKRDLERQRIDEIYKQNKKVVKQHGKVVSGGATASVTETGKLVWE